MGFAFELTMRRRTVCRSQKRGGGPGAGDFLDDYEGIGGHSMYRGEITLMYFPTLAPSGEVTSFALTPTRVRRFQLQRASPDEADWAGETLDELGRPFDSGQIAPDRLRLVGPKRSFPGVCSAVVGAPLADLRKIHDLTCRQSTVGEMYEQGRVCKVHGW